MKEVDGAGAAVALDAAALEAALRLALTVAGCGNPPTAVPEGGKALVALVAESAREPAALD